LAVKNAELLPYLYSNEVLSSEGKTLPFHVGLQFGFDYIEKFIQLPFPMPKPRTEDIDRFLKSISGRKSIAEDDPMSEIGSMSDPRGTSRAPLKLPDVQGFSQSATADENFQISFSIDSKHVRDVARKVSRFFDDNPRRLKQFINVFRLRAFVAYETGLLRPGRMTAQQLGKLVALQLRWPLWTAACLGNPEIRKALKGDQPHEVVTGPDAELKKELISLGTSLLSQWLVT
jgi:hypothetical protein